MAHASRRNIGALGAVLAAGALLLGAVGCGPSEEAKLWDELEEAAAEADAAHAAALAIEEQLNPDMDFSGRRGYYTSLAREPLEPERDRDERLRVLRDRLDRIKKAVPFLEAQRARMIRLRDRLLADREAREQRREAWEQSRQ